MISLPPIDSLVYFKFGAGNVLARVIEHRGPLGVGGEELVRVRFIFAGADLSTETEVPLADLREIPKQ